MFHINRDTLKLVCIEIIANQFYSSNVIKSCVALQSAFYALHIASPDLSYTILFYRFAVAMGYYGLSFSSGNLPGNIYLVFMLSGAIEFVAYTACLPINKLGRKGPHVFGMLLAGLACAGTIAIDLSSINSGRDSLQVAFLAVLYQVVRREGGETRLLIY